MSFKAITTLHMAIRNERTWKGLSQEAAADVAGVTRLTWLKIEQGDRKPSLDTLARIAYALEMKPSELLACVE